jgi:hypothetical protein
MEETHLLTHYLLNQSQLHYNSVEDKPGYSVTGTQFSIVNSLFQEYEDGKNTPIPEPTTFDLLDPLTADPDNKPKYIPTTWTNLF